jgi:hypothetical protein
MFELQETVVVPQPRTVSGIIDWQARLDEVVSVSATVPVNPLRSLIVIVEVAGWPALPVVGDAASIEKSGKLATLNVALTEWIRELLVP